jgi:hypothetical protein
MPATLSVKSFYPDAPLGKIKETLISYCRLWVEEIAMGKLWWFTMLVIVCVVFPVVAVITMGIVLAFIMAAAQRRHT